MRLNILLGIFMGICIVHVHCISDLENEENLNAAGNKPIVKSACEKSKLQVVCPKGRVIKIMQAIYGRKNNLAKCNPNANNKFNTKCRSSNSLTVMRQRCHMKRECLVDATNSVFGDPCPKTIKYLEIRYKCVAERVTTKITNIKTTTPRATTPEKVATTKIPPKKVTPQPVTTSKPKETTIILTTEKPTPKFSTKTTAELTTEKPTPKVSTFEDTTLREITTVENKPKSKHACEHDTLHIECEVGKVIRVLGANYGRTSMEVCPQNSAKHWNINCFFHKTEEIMKKMCDGKKNCNVAAENSVFNDPCGNTMKYLEVKYLCEDEITTKPPSTTHLDIESSVTTTYIPKTTQELPPSTTLKPLTEVLTITSTESPLTTSEMPVTTTRLPVTPSDDENKPKSKHACEHDTLHIECEVGKVIRVLGSNYGRTSMKVCSQNSAKHWNINCLYHKTEEIMRIMCDGKKNCNVAAKNSVFNDPCGGTMKYLEVNYLCEDDVTTIETTTDHPTTAASPVPEATSTHEPTPPVPSTSIISTPKPHVTDPETSSKPRVTAPETSCGDEDLDCIIDDLGKRPKWFICEKDMRSYPHPASKKLFIFCLNWKPSVKKCGQGRVFSEKLMTCINP